MSESNASGTSNTGTAEIPVIRPGATAPVEQPAPVPPVPAPVPTPADDNPPTGTESAPAPAPHETTPVSVRPTLRMPRRGPLTVMGPWAPVAGAVLGLVLGLVVVLLLAGSAETFQNRLALAFLVLGLGMLGASGVLLADEVRMIRQGARDAIVRPEWAQATVGLLNGLTPARLLLLVSGFVLFLAAYISR
jgi:hypothetical protein